MNILAFDLGSYSLKAFFLKKEKGFLKIDHLDEIFHHDFLEENPNISNLSSDEVSFHILQPYLESLRKDKSIEGRRIAFQYPLSKHSFRFLELPPVSLKKAEQMVPFQLEDGLPTSISQIHIAQEIFPSKEKVDINAYLSSKDGFSDYLQKLEAFNVVPDFLVSEISIMNSYARSMKPKDSYAIIDFAHY